MKRSFGMVVLVSLLFVVFLAATGCSASFTTANISSAVLAKDVEGDNFDPVDPTSVFSPDQAVIHLVVTLKNAPSDTTLKASWIAVDVGDAAPANTLIDEVEYTADGSGNVHFTLGQPSSGTWPVGKYKVDLSIDGKVAKTVDFTVQ